MREKNSQTLWLVQDIKMLRCNWCQIHTLTRQSGWCEIHTKKATIQLLQSAHLCAAIWLVRATYHSTRKHSYFLWQKLPKNHYFRCRRKAALILNSSASQNRRILLLFGIINSYVLQLLYFFSKSSSWTELFAGLLHRLRWTTLHATIW